LLTEMAVELGEEDPKVSLDHFVRLFVNHRSVFDIERTNFEEVFHFPRACNCTRCVYSLFQAFETLGTIGSNLLRSQRLIEVLAGAGEKMSKAEINECIATINRLDFFLASPNAPIISNTNG
jgi:Ca2+-binding EF-hand superfamily protein